MVLVALPFAAIGALVHLIPFQIMKQVGKRPANEGIKATVKLLGCFVLFALTYAVVGVLVGRAFGAWAGLGGCVRRAAVRLCGAATAASGWTDRRCGRGLPDASRPAGTSVVATALAHRAAVVAPRPTRC